MKWRSAQEKKKIMRKSDINILPYILRCLQPPVPKTSRDIKFCLYHTSTFYVHCCHVSLLYIFESSSSTSHLSHASVGVSILIFALYVYRCFIICSTRVFYDNFYSQCDHNFDKKVVNYNEVVHYYLKV